MIVFFRILLLAVLLFVLATLSSFKLLKATSDVLGDEEIHSGCVEDVRSSLRDAGLFLEGLFGYVKS